MCIAVLFGLFFLMRKPSTTEAPIITDTKTLSGNYCFKKELNKDITDVTLTILDGKVSGTMNWIPWEKDSARGTLVGAVTATGELDLIYDYIIEGAHQTETKIMKIEDGKLYIKHGELIDPKYDGHLIYKDVATAVYNETLEPCQ